ncbi:hypothetical protein ACLMMR_41395, partial [Streptomyces sp. NPDC000405]
ERPVVKAEVGRSARDTDDLVGALLDGSSPDPADLLTMTITGLVTGVLAGYLAARLAVLLRENSTAPLTKGR